MFIIELKQDEVLVDNLHTGSLKYYHTGPDRLTNYLITNPG